MFRIIVVTVLSLFFFSTVDSQPGRRGGPGSRGGGGGGNGDGPTTTISLSQEDFDDGTVVITQSNVRIELSEDIVFNPNSDYEESPNEEGAYFCLPEDADIFPGCDKTEGSFRLGFFAAISLEADHIVFDLNQHSLSVHFEFLVQMRFFTLIGIGKGPFIEGQGPTTFGSNINVQDIEIMNGHLGLSPHHGIHGNNMEDVRIHDLIIDQFEVAGIQLNGFKKAHLYDLEIGPSLRNVPVMGRYSQARFGLLSFREMKERLEQLPVADLEASYSVKFADRPGETLTAVKVVERLVTGMDLFFDYKTSGAEPQMDSSDYELFEAAMEIFDNESGDPDGSALYGILLNSAGAAVSWFGAGTTQYSENAVIEDVTIHDLNLRVNEVIAYKTEAGTHATGPYKGVLPMRLLLGLDSFDSSTFDLATDSFGNYVGNLLSDAQIVLAAFGEGDSELQRSTVDSEVIGWALGQNGLEKGKLLCNGDDMFHMDKGVVGIRVDRTRGLQMSDVSVRDLNNWSELGSTFCSTRNGTYDAHPQTPVSAEFGDVSNFKYQGRVARGMALTDVLGDIELHDIEIDGVVSSRGSAIGMDILGNTGADVDLSGNVRIDDVIACRDLSDAEAEFMTSDAAFPNNNILSCAMVNTDEAASFDEENGIELRLSDIDGPFVCLESVTPHLPSRRNNGN